MSPKTEVQLPQPIGEFTRISMQSVQTRLSRTLPPTRKGNIMQIRRSIEQVLAESQSTGPKPLPMGAPQFQPFFLVAGHTCEEAATILRVTPRGLGRFIRRGRLQASFVGHRNLVSEYNLQEFLRAQKRDFTETK